MGWDETDMDVKNALTYFPTLDSSSIMELFAVNGSIVFDFASEKNKKNSMPSHSLLFN